MSVYIGPSDSFESCLRRFNKQVSNCGLLAEARAHLRYESPKQRRIRKAARAKQRRKRAVSKKPTLFYN